MSSYFEEKSHQVICGPISACGINISSRYDKANEIIELIQFCQEVAKANLHKHIESIFYDSNACICCFEFKPTIYLGCEEERTLKEIALKIIRQFDWFGSVQHGPGGLEFEQMLQEFLSD